MEKMQGLKDFIEDTEAWKDWWQSPMRPIDILPHYSAWCMKKFSCEPWDNTPMRLSASIRKLHEHLLQVKQSFGANRSKPLWIPKRHWRILAGTEVSESTEERLFASIEAFVTGIDGWAMRWMRPMRPKDVYPLYDAWAKKYNAAARFDSWMSFAHGLKHVDESIVLAIDREAKSGFMYTPLWIPAKVWRDIAIDQCTI